MPSAAQRPSPRYRSVIVVLVLAMVLLGFFALGRLPVDLPPSSAPQRLNIQISTPGLIAPVIEEKLVRPVESALAEISGVKTMNTVITSGTAEIALQVNPHGDFHDVQRAAAARLEDLRPSLPASLEKPAILQADASSASVGFILTSRALDSLALRDWAETEFAKRLRELSGVSTVDIEGGTVREILILPDQRRLAGFGLSFEDVFLAIQKNPEAGPANLPPPGKSRSRRKPVHTGNLASMAALPVPLPGGEIIRLSEVAQLVLRHQPSATQTEGEEPRGIRVTVHKHGEAALSKVVERVRSHVDWMRANRLVPEGITLEDLEGQFDETQPLLKKITFAFLAGYALILIVVYLVWGIARRIVIFGVIVVASLQGVFVVMALFGTALDVVTLGGLAMLMGLLGGSVLLMYEPLPRISSSSRWSHPVVAPSMLLVAALVPVLMDSGELGGHFRKISIFIGIAWLLAAVLAAWLVPMFDVRQPRRSAEPWQAVMGHVFVRWRQAHDRLLRHLLRRAALTLSVAVAAIIVLLAVIFVQKQDKPALIELADHRITLRVQGADYPRLVALADEITLSLGQVDELSQVVHTGQASREELTFKMDEERAHELGVDVVMAGKALAVATSGIPVGSFRDAEHRYNVWMRLPPEDSGSVATGKILLLGELEHRPAVHLRDIALLERDVVPTRLRHMNGVPVIEITARTNNGLPSESVQRKVENAIARITIPSDIQIGSARPDNEFTEYRKLITPGLSVFLIFIVAWRYYRSLPLALTVLFTAFTTLISAVAVLSFLGWALSPPVGISLILLLGLSAGHASMLASSLVLLPAELSLWRRLHQATRQQFRPWLAMVITGILGMSSLLWIDGGISGLHVIITVLSVGLVLSLLVTLFLAPPLYRLFSRMEQIPADSRL